MPILATGRRERGFSLIELLVGLVIIAVLLGAVALAFPDTAARRGELAAERAEALLQLACERAELTGRDVGIALSRQSLAFGTLQAGRWQRFPDSPAEALRPRRLDADTQLGLAIEQRSVGLPEQLPERPQLACLASGELTPFELWIEGPGSARWRLQGEADGRLHRERDHVPR